MRALLGSLVLLLAACSSLPSGRPAEADERAVLEVVQAFFDVIESKDAEAGARLVVPEGVFVSVRLEEGRRVVRHFSNARWLEGLARDVRPMREAFEGEPEVRVDGDVALVRAPYVFEVDGQRSHAGVDLFTLVRTEDGWKVAGGAYSVVR